MLESWIVEGVEEPDSRSKVCVTVFSGNIVDCNLSGSSVASLVEVPFYSLLSELVRVMVGIQWELNSLWFSIESKMR